MLFLTHRIQELRELGVRGSAFRGWWEFKVRSGFAAHLEQQMLRRESELTSNGSALVDMTRLQLGSPDAMANRLRPWISGEAQSLLLQSASDAANGTILSFGRSLADFGEQIDWALNPMTGLRWRKDVHWTAALDDASTIGDIKLTWEVARLPQAYLMARAGTFFADRAGELCKRLVNQLTSFEREAPFGSGVHWYSGQEVSIRALAILFSYHAFGLPTDLEGILFRALLRTGLYIESHIEYAKHAVFNNHLIWEALGLYMAGSLLSLPEASRWESTGRQILDEQAERQIYADGGYIQQSHTYHRMAIQGYLIASRLAGTLPATWRGALDRSLEFLTAQQNPETGQLPNFGANDGTLPCILSTCDYTDFRPTLQAVSLLVRGERQYPPGPWDEEVAWLRGPSVLDAPMRRPIFASRSFEQAGQHVLRGRSACSFGSFRCGSLQDRFGQIDMLHLDVSWRGHNVLTDPGSFMYNGPAEWHNHFCRTESHNTIQLDGRDQMVHFRRFKNLYWTKAKLLYFKDSPDLGLVVGEHYGYERYPGQCIHRRSVIFAKDDIWVVIDRISGSGAHAVRLHWLASEYPFAADDSGSSLRLTTPDGLFTVSTYDEMGRPVRGDVIAGGETPPRGWLSRYYAEKVPVPSFAVELDTKLPIHLISVLCSGVPTVECRGSQWTVSAAESCATFTFAQFGVDPQSVRLLQPMSSSRQ